jgi:hypothetical protein
LGACSSISEPAVAPEVGAPPDAEKLLAGIKQGIADSHFELPIEVTDPIRATPVSSSPWLLCIRSAKTEESKRITYSAFFKDAYTNSRYSAIDDGCATQVYHPFKEQPIPNATRKKTTGPKLRGGQK